MKLLDTLPESSLYPELDNGKVTLVQFWSGEEGESVAAQEHFQTKIVDVFKERMNVVSIQVEKEEEPPEWRKMREGMLLPCFFLFAADRTLQHVQIGGTTMKMLESQVKKYVPAEKKAKKTN